ncbi:MAG: hypothetical protein E7319_03855 [Clostridiales bacterium]|nr:hypothetical protein [Clostridiales bacterium]
MATWVTHLMVADRVLERIPALCRHEFCVGSIAPDCNVENEDWTAFIPPREVTHWMTGGRKVAADCDRFVREYMDKRQIASAQEESFLLGYYAHLITDAEFQRTIRDEERVKAAWGRVLALPHLREKAADLPATWDSIKLLLPAKERMRDVHTLDREYLEQHPASGYLTEIMGLKSFPDYIDYLPKNAIPRKVKVMGVLPEVSTWAYAYIAMTAEEYHAFVDRTVDLVACAVAKYLSRKSVC